MEDMSPLSNGNDRDIFLADVHDGDELLGLATPGGRYHYISRLKELRAAMDCFCGRDEVYRSFDAAIRYKKC